MTSDTAIGQSTNLNTRTFVAPGSNPDADRRLVEAVMEFHPSDHLSDPVESLKKIEQALNEGASPYALSGGQTPWTLGAKPESNGRPGFRPNTAWNLLLDHLGGMELNNGEKIANIMEAANIFMKHGASMNAEAISTRSAGLYGAMAPSFDDLIDQNALSAAWTRETPGLVSFRQACVGGTRPLIS